MFSRSVRLIFIHSFFFFFSFFLNSERVTKSLPTRKRQKIIESLQMKVGSSKHIHKCTATAGGETLPTGAS